MMEMIALIAGDSLFGAVYITGLLVGSTIRVVYAKGERQRAAPRRHRESFVVRLCMGLWGLSQAAAVISVGGSLLRFADYRLPVWAGWCGAVVFAVALWLLARSHADLGKHWSPYLQVKDDHALVARGVYRHIRHPMYAAHLLWGVAQLLLVPNWVAGPGALLTFLPVYLIRVGHEEEMMIQAFGDEYRSYMARTGRLMPRLRA